VLVPLDKMHPIGDELHQPDTDNESYQEKTTMTSRERVLRAVRHEEGPLAVDFGGLHSSLHLKSYQEVVQAMGWELEEPNIQDWFQMIVFPQTRLLEYFGADCVPVYPNPGSGWELNIMEEGNNQFFTNEWGIVLRKPKDGYFFDLYSCPMQKAVSLDEIKKYAWPDPEDPARIKGLKEKLQRLRRETDKALVLFNPIGGTHEHSYFLRGLTELLLDLAANPDIADYLAAKVAEWQAAYFSFVLREIGQYVDIVQVGDDLGTTNGLIFSRDMYLKYYKNREKTVIDAIQKACDAHIYFHSCGSIREVIPDLIDIGVEILNPVQIQARNMDSAELKRDFGRDLTFWGGGCDPRVLTIGSKENVRDEVNRRIEDFMKDGGFVFASVHNIQANDPPENIITMFETAGQYR
jgi:uroporphyrinogen decarboxylase